MHRRPHGIAATRRGLIAVMCVIALHIALYIVLRGSAGWQLRSTARPAPERAEVTLRLLPWLQPLVPVTHSAPVAPRAHAEAQQPAPRRTPEAITVAAPTAAESPATATATESTSTSAAIAPEPPASQPMRPLDLTLRPGYATQRNARNPGLDDSRANTARLTPEERMAARFDTRVIEEELGDDRRIRRGADCVIVRPARIGQLMPFNESAARAPSLVGACP